MSFASELFDVLDKARADNGGTIQKGQWLAIVDAFFDKKAPKRKPKATPVSKMTDDEWIAYLEADPAMSGIDVKRELGKCQFWCRDRGVKFSRRRFSNWLLKAERTITTSGAGQSSRAPSTDIYREPEYWHTVFARLYPNAENTNPSWFDLSPDVRKAILRELLK